MRAGRGGAGGSGGPPGGNDSASGVMRARHGSAGGTGEPSGRNGNDSVAGSAADFGEFRPVPALIEAQADRHPDRTAVCHGDQVLSYGGLDRLANGLAAAAAGRGAGKGDRVAILVRGGLELPVAYLAMMKLGAVFVPLDPAWPADRLLTTLRVLAPALVLCAGRGDVPDGYRDAAMVVAAGEIPASRVRPAVPLGPRDPAYGFFTSGTTGVPKCAVNRHEGLANRLRFMSAYMPARGDEVVLQNSKHTVDSSLWQLCWPLITGGRTVLPGQGEFLNLQHTIDTIARYAVTSTDFVSSVFNVLVTIIDGDAAAQRKLASLRHVVVGSEEINSRAVHRLRAMLPHVRVSNGYGPTETSIGMVFHQVSEADGDKIPLGRPISNCYVAVLAPDRGLLPRGETGEIAIGGACVGEGYHADPAATSRAFIPNHLAHSIPGDRLYLSGDLGYLDDQGRLFFAGRKDFQVKIGGVRIELGEIELAALSGPGVRQAKALTSERDDARSLAVFAVGDAALTDAALRDHLRPVLPRTSLPRHCVVLSEMPLTESGKLDWRALRALLDARLDAEAARLAAGSGDGNGHAAADGRAPAAAELPAIVLRALRSELGDSGLRADDDFIAAGGDSIQALFAIRALARQCAADVGVQDLLDHPTARRLAAAIARRRDGAPPPAGPAATEAAGAATPEAAAGAEAELMERDSVLSPAEPIRPVRRGGPPRAVLLTGATGFVGSRLAHDLLARGDLRVYCLARAPDHAAAARRVSDAMAARQLWEPGFAGRIEGVAGDLGQPGLGLDPRTWQRLAADCDLILHNGALVNFLYDYRAHRPANVSGTAELLRLAMAGRPAPLHYVSTLAALQGEAGAGGGRRPGRLGEYVDPDGAAMPRGGYGRSKWVAERYLAGARQRGAVVTVLRLGEIMPSQERTHPNALALTHLLLSAIHRLGVRPDVSIRSDYTPVDYASARVVAAVLDRRMWGRTLHVFHPGSVCFAEALPRAGAAVSPVSCREFLDRLHSAVTSASSNGNGSGNGDRRDLARLAALLPAPDGRGEAELRAELAGLLTDSPALFRKDECRRLEQRARLADGDLAGPIAAYLAYLSRPGTGPAASAASAAPGRPATSAVPATPAPMPASPAYDRRGRP
jgi:amino acid adenylation domain-containing protein/thioester reductase-like protein